MAFLNQYIQKSISKSSDPEFRKEMMMFKITGKPIAATYHLYRKGIIKTVPTFMRGFSNKLHAHANKSELAHLTNVQTKLYPNLINSYLNDDREIVNILHRNGFISNPHDIKATNFDMDFVNKYKLGAAFVTSYKDDTDKRTIYLNYDCMGGVKHVFTNNSHPPIEKAYVRFFILCHELAHPEIMKFKNKDFNFPEFPDNFNKKVNANFLSRYSSSEKLKLLHNEVFADAYGAMMFLHGFDFSENSLEIVDRVKKTRELILEHQKKLQDEKKFPFFDIYQLCPSALGEIIKHAPSIKKMSPDECLNYARDIATRNTLKILRDPKLQKDMLEFDSIDSSLKRFVMDGMLASSRGKEQEFLDEFNDSSKNTIHQSLYLYVYNNFKKTRQVKTTLRQLIENADHLFSPNDFKSKVKFDDEIGLDFDFFMNDMVNNPTYKYILNEFEGNKVKLLSSLANNINYFERDLHDDYFKLTQGLNANFLSKQREKMKEKNVATNNEVAVANARPSNKNLSF